MTNTIEVRDASGRTFELSITWRSAGQWVALLHSGRKMLVVAEGSTAREAADRGRDAVVNGRLPATSGSLIGTMSRPARRRSRRSRAASRRSRSGKFERLQHEHLQRIVDTQSLRDGDDIPGVGYADGTGALVTYHVTDNPQAVQAIVQRRGNLMAAYGKAGQHSELGPGAQALRCGKTAQDAAPGCLASRQVLRVLTYHLDDEKRDPVSHVNAQDVQ